jgi:hypothetical protein
MGNGVLDSDLPVDNNDQYRYLSDMLIIAADVTDNPIGDNVVTVGDKKYDVSDGLMLLDNDAGLTTMDKSIIEGIVWDDKNYDGQQNEYTNADGENEDEPGISDVELQLIPYYYDDPTNTWKALDENDMATLETKMNELEQVAQQMAAYQYQQSQGANPTDNGNAANDDVVDADFTEKN